MTAFLTIPEIGILLSGIAAILGAALAAMKHFQDRAEARLKEHCNTTMANSMRAVIKALANSTLAKIKGMDPLEIITFDVRFKSGEQVCVPLIMKQWIQYLPSMSVMMTRHTAHETEILMDITDPAFLPWHSHSEAEIVTVLRGRMIDLTTGNIYNPGDSWVIPAEIFHRAQFDAGTLCQVICRPPLLDSTRRAVNMAEIEHAFEYEAAIP